MSSPFINCIMCLGALLAYVSCVLYPLETFTVDSKLVGHISCQGRSWLLAPSFTFMFGAMITKSWRVKKIFTHAPAKRIVSRCEVYTQIHNFFAVPLSTYTI